jgi:cytochrome c553
MEMYVEIGAWGSAVVGRTRDRFPVVSLDFSVTYSFQPFHGPGVDSAPSENEYQEHFLGVKAAGACAECHGNVGT